MNAQRQPIGYTRSWTEQKYSLILENEPYRNLNGDIEKLSLRDKIQTCVDLLIRTFVRAVTYSISDRVGCLRRSRVNSRPVPPYIQTVHFFPVQ